MPTLSLLINEQEVSGHSLIARASAESENENENEIEEKNSDESISLIAQVTQSNQR